MESSGFLKSVSFGGFDKKDVLAYVDDLNTKIYTLESELEDAKKKAGSGTGAKFEGKEAYEEMLAKERSKSSELMAKVDTLNLTIKSNENTIAEKDKEIEKLKERMTELENNVTSAPTEETSSFDIGSVFIEAKKSADKIVSEARAAVKKMDSDAKALAEQIIEEANNKAERTVSEAISKAEKIVSEANTKSEKIMSNAETRSAELEKLSADVKLKVKNTIDSMFDNIVKVNEAITDFSRSSNINLEKAKSILSEAKNDVEGSKSNNTETVAVNNKPQEQVHKSVEAPKLEKVEEEEELIPESVAPAAKPVKKASPTDDLANLLAQVEAEASTLEGM